MKSHRPDPDKPFYQITLAFADYPIGFRDLLVKEADWSKWVCSGPSMCNYTDYAAIDGNDIIGLISDLEISEESFTFMYQDLRGFGIETVKFWPRGYHYMKEDKDHISQFFCFDAEPTPTPQPFEMVGGGKFEPIIECFGPEPEKFDAQAHYAQLLTNSRRT
uniref:Uncharacterized protein n=1 Tax=Pseudomonas phage RVTF4 TaxID=3236931 RepID=A0AB39CCU2_9VIRU